MFNVGVEIGQLMFVAAVLSVGALVGRFVARSMEWAMPLGAYAIGSVAALWTIERVLSF